MKEIGKAEEISDYEEQITYLEDILSQLEDLQSLYAKDSMFEDDYKEITNQMKWLDEKKQELADEKEELEQEEYEDYKKELFVMNYEFERSRL